jgi:pimeloyl-ACP methyl ester carboxylesterase
MTEHIPSADDTTIAFDRSGAGPALVLLMGAFCDRKTPAALVPLLTPHFTVFAYDRRGRGASGDTAPYAVEREIEDLEAVIGAAGGSAFVYGHSSGAVLALLAAARGAPITKLVAYEPPYVVDDTRRRAPADLGERVAALVAAGRRDDAIEAFLLEAVEVPPQIVAMIHQSPDYPGMQAIAHTLVYDILITDEQRLPTDVIAKVSVPTLVVAGGASPAWAQNGVRAVAETVPGGRSLTIADQDHGVAPDAIAPVLVEFFAS